MATLTIAIDPALREAGKQEAQRRQTTLDQLVSDYIASLARVRPSAEENAEFIRLMNEGPLGHMDRPLSREEIYEERMWPRS